jgi:hypothetical protein
MARTSVRTQSAMILAPPNHRTKRETERMRQSWQPNARSTFRPRSGVKSYSTARFRTGLAISKSDAPNPRCPMTYVLFAHPFADRAGPRIAGAIDIRRLTDAGACLTGTARASRGGRTRLSEQIFAILADPSCHRRDAQLTGATGVVGSAGRVRPNGDSRALAAGVALSNGARCRIIRVGDGARLVLLDLLVAPSGRGIAYARRTGTVQRAAILLVAAGADSGLTGGAGGATVMIVAGDPVVERTPGRGAPGRSAPFTGIVGVADASAIDRAVDAAVLAANASNAYQPGAAGAVARAPLPGDGAGRGNIGHPAADGGRQAGDGANRGRAQKPTPRHIRRELTRQSIESLSVHGCSLR